MKFVYSLLFLLACPFVYSQDLSFKKYVFEWPDAKPDISKMTNSFNDNDLVVINENVKINVVDRLSQTLTKTCILKINNAAGLKKASVLLLPESFDIGADKHYSQQGQESKRKIPYIYKNRIIYYAARVLKADGKVINLPIDSRTEFVYWNYYDGLQLSDYEYFFSNKGLETGDILEYSYKIEFQGRYGYNLFYFNGEVPKQNVNFEIKYSPINIDGSTQVFADYNIINSSNGADSVLQKSSIYDDVKAKKHFIYSYNYKNLTSINYPLNSRSGKTLPHVFVDLNFLSFYGMSHVPNEALILADRGPQFEWIFAGKNDSFGYQASVYDKQHAAVRKFLTKFPSTINDDVYYTSLCDSLNAQRFVSAQSMRYSENSQYSVSSGEWLTKRKIVEEFMEELYWQLLNEKKRTTYFVSVQDKRLGEIKFNTHVDTKYQFVFLGVPNGNTIRFILPRYKGLKYNSDELPFYLEGVNAAVSAVNYSIFNMSNFTTSNDYYRLARVFKFIKTPGSTENENVRIENGVFNIDLDSAIIRANIKENLNGQFSTIIRPIYFNELIDSTVYPVYFKKCTDKPNAKNIKIKSTSRSNVFPFKYSFNCSEDISLINPSELSLKDWFSFVLNNSMIDQLPNFDFYVDFKYSDMYNYLLQFNRSVTIENISEFTKSINNKYFELNSNLVKQSESSYLLSLNVKVKQEVIPKEDGQLLLDLVKELDSLNKGILKLK